MVKLIAAWNKFLLMFVLKTVYSDVMESRKKNRVVPQFDNK